MNHLNAVNAHLTNPLTAPLLAYAQPSWPAAMPLQSLQCGMVDNGAAFSAQTASMGSFSSSSNARGASNGSITPGCPSAPGSSLGSNFATPHYAGSQPPSPFGTPVASVPPQPIENLIPDTVPNTDTVLVLDTVPDTVPGPDTGPGPDEQVGLEQMAPLTPSLAQLNGARPV